MTNSKGVWSKDHTLHSLKRTWDWDNCTISLAISWSTSIIFKIVAPSFVTVTSLSDETISLSSPFGPRDVLSVLAIDLAAQIWLYKNIYNVKVLVLKNLVLGIDQHKYCVSWISLLTYMNPFIYRIRLSIFTLEIFTLIASLPVIRFWLFWSRKIRKGLPNSSKAKLPTAAPAIFLFKRMSSIYRDLQKVYLWTFATPHEIYFRILANILENITSVPS